MPYPFSPAIGTTVLAGTHPSRLMRVLEHEYSPVPLCLCESERGVRFWCASAGLVEACGPFYVANPGGQECA